MKIYEFRSDHFDDRPAGVAIDTLIVHSMFDPQSKNPFSLAGCRKLLDYHGVSAHYLIGRKGRVEKLVDVNNRARHAGVSRLPGKDRENVNDFSIGVELIGSTDSGFTDIQYEQLTMLTSGFVSKYPLQYIYGHCHIAPERKSDPWGFDWKRFKKKVIQTITAGKKLTFPEW